jgi:hypothetical protein
LWKSAASLRPARAARARRIGAKASFAEIDPLLSPARPREAGNQLAYPDVGAFRMDFRLRENERKASQLDWHALRFALHTRRALRSLGAVLPRRERRSAALVASRGTKISKGAEDAAQGDGAGLAISDADDPEAMEHAALCGAPRLCGAGAVQSARLLARLRQRALPPGAMLPPSASLLLGSQAGHDAGGMGESDAVCRPLRGLLSIGSLKGSVGLWLF